MANSNLPRISPLTQYISEIQAILETLADLREAHYRFAEEMKYSSVRMHDLLAIQRGEMIEGEYKVVQNDC